jgi:hypothetical protein
LSLRLRLAGAQYLLLGVITVVAAVTTSNSLVVAGVVLFSMAVTALTQLAGHQPLLAKFKSLPTLDRDVIYEERRAQIMRTSRILALQLPILIGLIVGQYFLFNALDQRADARIDLGGIFLSLVAGAFLGYGLSSVMLGYRVHSWEAEEGCRLLEEVRPGGLWRQAQTPSGRAFVDVKS